MKITCLLENSAYHPCCAAEHGLSLYVETASHILLLDFGQTLAALENAKQLGIDVSKADTAFLSHGHYDHSGSLLAFANLAPAAKIYMQRQALEPHYHGERYIGVAPEIANLSQIRLLDGDCTIDSTLSVFAGIHGRRLYPQGNLELETLRGGKRIQDDFAHEQCLVIHEGGRRYLLSGCAHNGILNILARFREIYGADPDFAVTGFHMMKQGDYTEQELSVIQETAQALTKLKTQFVSGHCTGESAFAVMHDIMGEQLTAMGSGKQIL